MNCPSFISVYTPTQCQQFSLSSKGIFLLFKGTFPYYANRKGPFEYIE